MEESEENRVTVDSSDISYSKRDALLYKNVPGSANLLDMTRFSSSDYCGTKDPWLHLQIYKKEDMSDLFNVFIQKDEFLMIKENSIIEFWTRVKGITVQFSSNNECEEVYQHIQGCIINNESNITEALQFGILVKIM